MKKIVFAHFYNEEYLLPFWLKHHKRIFDHGVLFNYASTDRSCEIIKEICPNWEIYESENKTFSAADIEKEILIKEHKYNQGDYRAILNVTEFLICKSNFFAKSNEKIQFLVPSFAMFDNKQNLYKDLEPNKPLIKQRTNGLDYKTHFHFRKSRSIHNYNINSYPLGRHYNFYNTEDAVICWYGFSPFNKKTIKRKMQIGSRVPIGDKRRGWGFQHLWPEERIKLEYYNNIEYTINLKEKIESYE